MKRDQDTASLLERLRGGQREALDALFPMVYAELSAAARAQLRRASDIPTINTTSLVHEAYLRLAEQRRLDLKDRRHFLALAGLVMRRLIVNYARDRRRHKRGGGQLVLSLDQVEHQLSEERAAELVALDEALERLAEIDPRAAQVVDCRYFAGLSIEETAEALGVSAPTVKRDWNLARAWLKREIAPDG